MPNWSRQRQAIISAVEESNARKRAAAWGQPVWTTTVETEFVVVPPSASLRSFLAPSPSPPAEKVLCRYCGSVYGFSEKFRCAHCGAPEHLATQEPLETWVSDDGCRTPVALPEPARWIDIDRVTI